MKLSDAVATRLDELLRQNGKTQYRLSLDSGVPQSTISDIRLKKNKAVNLRIVYELAQGFGMELADFFDSPLFREHNITD